MGVFPALVSVPGRPCSLTDLRALQLRQRRGVLYFFGGPLAYLNHGARRPLRSSNDHGHGNWTTNPNQKRIFTSSHCDARTGSGPRFVFWSPQAIQSPRRGLRYGLRRGQASELQSPTICNEPTICNSGLQVDTILGKIGR